jgi:hypothetical protein
LENLAVSTWNPFVTKPTTPPPITKPRPTKDSKPFNKSEALAEAESRIERGLSHFLEVGEALRYIQNAQLYFRPSQPDQGYPTWKDYLERRWRMTEQHAMRLIAASEVVHELAGRGYTVLPVTESQARPLASLPKEKAAEVWSEVVATTPPEAITAAAIEEKALKYRKPRRNRNRKPAAVKLRGKGWRVTIERDLATTDLEAVLFEAIDRLKDLSKPADKKSEAA